MLYIQGNTLYKVKNFMQTDTEFYSDTEIDGDLN